MEMEDNDFEHWYEGIDDMEFDVSDMVAYEEYLTMGAVKGAMSRLDKLRSQAYNAPANLREKAMKNFKV